MQASQNEQETRVDCTSNAPGLDLLPLPYDLKQLRAVADAATDAAHHQDWSGTWVAVNWGDLCCVSAEHYVTEEGQEGYRVYIEEADPNNPEFCKFIGNKLDAAGYRNIEVLTEW